MFIGGLLGFLMLVWGLIGWFCLFVCFNNVSVTSAIYEIHMMDVGLVELAFRLA